MDEWNLLGIYTHIIKFFERLLGLGVFIACIVYAYQSFEVISKLDWSQNQTFYDLIYRILLIIIGLELIRMLITHSLSATLELLGFVIARKVLLPELSSVDIALNVVAFIGLLGARHYFVRKAKREMLPIHIPPKK